MKGRTIRRVLVYGLFILFIIGLICMAYAIASATMEQHNHRIKSCEDLGMILDIESDKCNAVGCNLNYQCIKIVNGEVVERKEMWGK